MYKVLIADDEQAICKGMCVIIDWESYGYNTPDIAEDGEDALEKLNVGTYNLIITDIRMPVIDGLELIKSIRDKNPFIKILIISGYSDFKYAKEAMEYDVKGYMLKPINRNELAKYISNIKSELDAENISSGFCESFTDSLRNKLLSDLIEGRISDTNLKEVMENIGIEQSYNCFCVGMLEVDNYKSIVKGNQESANFIKFSVRNIIEKILGDRKWGLVYEYSENIFGILFFGKNFQDDSNKINELLKLIQSIVFGFIKARINIGYGSIVSSISRLKDSSIQAMNVIKQEHNMNIDVTEIKDYSDSLVYNNISNAGWDIKDLLFAIETMDEQKINSEINVLVNNIMHFQNTKDMTHVIFLNFVFPICTMLNKYNGDAVHIFNLKEISSMTNNGMNVAKLSAWLSLKCNETSNYIGLLQQNKSQKTIFEVKEYIDKHYQENINLKSIANVFYLNSSYLGRLFTNTFGITFNDYLNKVRIAGVKEIVLHGDKSIYEIIIQVGYNNHEHFYRQFKRYEGISFLEFRENAKLYKA